SASVIEIPRSCSLATMERIPPPKPRRNEDALCETAGAAPHGAGLRPTGRGASGPYRRSERLHRARHPCHRARGISLSGERGTPAISRFVQQSPRLSGFSPGIDGFLPLFRDSPPASALGPAEFLTGTD